MLLSICLVNWNTREDLRECLQSLRRFPFTGGETEVIVVDNASRDGSAQMLRADFPEVRLIANTTNEIFARGVNQCLEIARGDLLLLLNPDVTAREGSLDRLVATLGGADDIQIAAPRLVFPDGATQKSVRGFPAPLALLADMLQLWRIFPRSRRFAAYRMPFFDYDAPGDAPQPMASALLFTRRVYDAIGGMDERFPLFFNDADWSLRAHDAGFRTRYNPTAVFTHKGGGTTKRVRRAAVWESHRALLRFYAKHYRRKTSPVLYHLITTLVILGAWARTGRWGTSLGSDGGDTTPAGLHRELEREG